MGLPAIAFSLAKLLLGLLTPNSRNGDKTDERDVGWRQRWTKNSTEPEEPTNPLLQEVYRGAIAMLERELKHILAGGNPLINKIIGKTADMIVILWLLYVLLEIALWISFAILGHFSLSTATLTTSETFVQHLAGWIQRVYDLLP
jgi:hypothetical protein